MFPRFPIFPSGASASFSSLAYLSLCRKRVLTFGFEKTIFSGFLFHKFTRTFLSQFPEWRRTFSTTDVSSKRTSGISSFTSPNEAPRVKISSPSDKSVSSISNKSKSLFEKASQLLEQGTKLIARSSFEDAETSLLSALYTYNNLNIQENTQKKFCIGNTHLKLAYTYQHLKRYSEGIQHYEEAITLFQGIPKEEKSFRYVVDHNIAYCLNGLSDIHSSLGNYTQAAEFCEQSFAIFERLQSEKISTIGENDSNSTRRKQNQHQQEQLNTTSNDSMSTSGTAVENSIATTKTIQPIIHSSLLGAQLNNLAGYLSMQNKFHEAKLQCKRALSLLEEDLGECNRLVDCCLENLVRILKAGGMNQELEILQREWKAKLESRTQRLEAAGLQAGEQPLNMNAIEKQLNEWKPKHYDPPGMFLPSEVAIRQLEAFKVFNGDENIHFSVNLPSSAAAAPKTTTTTTTTTTTSI